MDNTSGMPAASPGPAPAQPSAADAQFALDALAQDRGTLADLAVTPWWYHPVLAGLVFLFVVGTASAQFWYLTFLAYMVGLAWLVRAYRNLTGIWANGWRIAQGRVLSVVLFAVLLAGVLTSLAVRRGQLDWWWAVVAAVVGALTTLWLGPRLDATVRAALRNAA
ncbi:MAG: hypothetical protein U0Q14_02290 [Dermatophilaceae bacterium]